jgi:hypothetical protein
MQTFSTQNTTLDRLFGWWYAIAAPSAVSDAASLREKNFMRRARFTSVILLMEIIYSLFSFAVSGDFAARAKSIIAVSIVSFVVAAILNRSGKTVASGMLSFAVVEISICLNIVNSGFASGGFAEKGLTIIPTLIVPELIAISLLPGAVALFLCAFNCIFSIVAVLTFPKTPEMLHLLATSGFLSYFQTVGIQCVVIAVCFFWASSAVKEMKRADRAEEVGKLTQTLAFQQNAALVEKQQLEENMQQIIAVHTQVANGDFSARVPLDQHSMLWSIGISLNNLLARLQLWRQDEQQQRSTEQSMRHNAQQQRTEQAIKQIIYEIQRAKRQGTPLHLHKTGTSLDLIFAELSRKPSSDPAPVELPENQPPPQTLVELYRNTPSRRAPADLPTRSTQPPD